MLQRHGPVSQFVIDKKCAIKLGVAGDLDAVMESYKCSNLAQLYLGKCVNVSNNTHGGVALLFERLMVVEHR